MNKPLSPALPSHADLRNPEGARRARCAPMAEEGPLPTTRKPNDHMSPERQRQQTEHMRTTADGREGGEPDRAFATRHGMSAEAARNEAEQFRRLAEEAREVRDYHREALETIREERERRRDTAETARATSEEARGAAEAARQAMVDAVRASAETLNATLDQMKVVEEMRRTLREIRDVNKLDSN